MTSKSLAHKSKKLYTSMEQFQTLEFH